MEGYITFHRILRNRFSTARWTRPNALLTDYLHSELRPVVGTCRHVLDLAESEHAINDPAKHDMLSVQEVAFGRGDEELEPEVQTGECMSSEAQN